MEVLFTSSGLTSLLTLTALEIVLGVDNIIFVSIIASKLPKNEQTKARSIGLFLAMFIRIGLLFILGWILSLQKDLFNLQDFGFPMDMGFSGKDLILLIGGVFLLYKTVSEIHQKLEGDEDDITHSRTVAVMSKAIMDITVINIVFSLDSIITAVGLTENITIMAGAVVLFNDSHVVIRWKSRRFSWKKHPTIKMLALSFLVMIGTLLIAEAFKVHVPKGYVYFSMAFSFLVESLNMRVKSKSKPVNLRDEIK